MDLGCAGGAICFGANQRGSVEVVGVERDKRKLDQGKAILAQTGVSGISFVESSIEEYLESASRSFDFVFLLNMVHHLRYPAWVLDRIAEMTLQGVIIETPSKRMYVPYEPDKGKERSFLIPWGPSKIRRHMSNLGFASNAKDSPNPSSYIGGKRHLFFFETEKGEIEKATLESDKEVLLVGPHGSGKSTAIRSSLKLDDNISLADKKFRPSRPLFDQSTQIKKFGDISNWFSYAAPIPPLAYLAPTVGTPRLRFGFRSSQHNARAWVKEASKLGRPVVVTFCTRSERKQRLHLRFLDRFYRETGDWESGKTLLEKASNLSVASRKVKEELKKIHPRKKRKMIREQLRDTLAGTDFSYERLFTLLASSKIQFSTLDTNPPQ